MSLADIPNPESGAMIGPARASLILAFSGLRDAGGGGGGVLRKEAGLRGKGGGLHPLFL